MLLIAAEAYSAKELDMNPDEHIRGIVITEALDDVFNELGPGLLREDYIKATSLYLNDIDVEYESEPVAMVNYKGNLVAILGIEFVIEKVLAVSFHPNQPTKRDVARIQNFVNRHATAKEGWVVYFLNDKWRAYSTNTYMSSPMPE